MQLLISFHFGKEKKEEEKQVKPKHYRDHLDFERKKLISMPWTMNHESQESRIKDAFNDI